MSLTIELTPDQEQQVREAAGRAGRSPETLVGDLVSRALQGEWSAANHRPIPISAPEDREVPVEEEKDYRGVFPGWDVDLQPGVYSMPGGVRLIVGPSSIGPDGKDIYEGLRATPEELERLYARTKPFQPEDIRRFATGSPEDLPPFLEAMAECRRKDEGCWEEANRRWDKMSEHWDEVE